MPVGYIAAVSADDASPADRATLCTFIPCSRWEMVLAAAAGLYAHARWRSKAYTAMVAFAGFKVPILAGIALGLEAMQATRRRMA